MAPIRGAREIGMITVKFTGFDGEQLRLLVDQGVHVESLVMGVVEDAHTAPRCCIVCTLRGEDGARGWA